MIKEHKQVILKKTHRYVNEGEGEGEGGEDTNNMCRVILVEPLSEMSYWIMTGI